MEVRHVQMAPGSFGQGVFRPPGDRSRLRGGLSDAADHHDRPFRRAERPRRGVGFLVSGCLIAWLKANPDSLGRDGRRRRDHLTGISFQRATGTRFQLGSRNRSMSVDRAVVEFQALLASGGVKPFAITGKARLPSAAAIPTADEPGLPVSSPRSGTGCGCPRARRALVADHQGLRHQGGVRGLMVRDARHHELLDLVLRSIARAMRLEG